MRELDEATYVSGTWVAIATRAGCLLVDLSPEDPVVRRCWKLLSENSGADAVLDALVGGGVATTPGFALVVRTALQARAVARYPGVVAVHNVDRDESIIEAQPSTSWVDVIVDGDLDAITLRGPATNASVELPMGTGVTSAAVVHLHTSAPVDAVGPPTAPTAEFVPPEASIEPEPAIAPIEPEIAPDKSVPAEPLPVDSYDAAAAEDSYDHLFGASVQRELPAPPVEHTAGWLTESPALRPTTALPATPETPSDGLIEDVPWLTSPSSSDPSEASSPVSPDSETATMEATGDDDVLNDEEPAGYGATVNRAALRAQAAPPGPTVLAGQCPSGHLSPPHADRCRICRAPMPAQDAFEIARPQLGVLQLQSGDVVALDRGVLLGRSPDVPSGSERPHVLRLKSPENDISRNHAEVVLDGWNVYVRDLGSTNGTTVELPGRPPVRLRENELTLLEDRARVTLADEVTVVFAVQE